MKLVLSSLAFAGGMAFGLSNASADTYTVQQGDTLNKLAKANNVTVQKIADDNKIENINLIYVGEQIDINPVFTQTKVPTTVVETPKAEVVIPHVEQQQPAQPAPTGGDVHAQFIAAGGSESMWNTIVLPESGGQPDITSPNGYHGLGQTKESWGYGSVEEQTKGMINYANSRYGSVGNALAFRSSNNWW